MREELETGKDKYAVIVHCSNCGLEATTEIRRGTPIKDAECLKCGCSMLIRVRENKVADAL